MSVRECMIDYMIEMTCIYVCALLCFYHVEIYVLIYYHVNYCKAAQALVHCLRYELRQVLNYYEINHIRTLLYSNIYYNVIYTLEYYANTYIQQNEKSTVKRKYSQKKHYQIKSKSFTSSI